jgi:hypothetical protein
VEANVGTYAGLLQRACPAGVYEYVPDDGGRVVPGNSEKQEEGWEGKKLVINSQVRASVFNLHEGGLLLIVDLELHPLQAVRYQGADAGYYVDYARGRWWAEV